MFADRKDAALQLAKGLEKYSGTNTLVLGIPRGGAETAYYVATHLGVEFSILISRKLGHPANPEYAIGAIAEDGSLYLSLYARAEFSDVELLEIVAEQKTEILRRIKLLRNGEPIPELKGRNIILVDDGIATGATLFAAIEMCRKKQAGKIIIAAPVSGPDIRDRFADKADELLVLEMPENFHAVSHYYQFFPQLSDDEVIGFMERWQRKNFSTMHMNTIGYFEIQSSDPARDTSFYSAVFGWKFTLEPNLPIEYYRIETNSMNGGLLKRPSKIPPPESGTNAFVCSVQVVAYDEIHDRIMQHGGRVALPKFAVPGRCWQGYYLDPDNNTFGVFEVDENAR